MRRTLIGSLVLAVLLVAAAALVEPAAAGTGKINLKVSKDPDGPYNQTIRVNVGPDDTKNIYLKAIPRSGTVESGHLSEDFDPDGFLTKYFKMSGVDITGAVANSLRGYAFTTKPFKPKTFRMRIAWNGGPAICVLDRVTDDMGGRNGAMIAINIPVSACFD
jgi:hypothetical protein